MRRQYEMPYDHAAREQITVKDAVRLLPHHLAKRRVGGGRVIGRIRIARGKRARCVFIIGQINIDKSFKCAQGFYALIAARVPDKRQRKAPCLCLADGGDNLPCILRGRHEIDVVYALFGKLKENVAQALDRNVHTEAAA